MARKQKQSNLEEPERQEEKEEALTRLSHAIWKGSITFGLVNIPVSLHTAEARKEISFKLLKRENLSPIHYKRVDESSGSRLGEYCARIRARTIRRYQRRRLEPCQSKGNPDRRNTLLCELQ
jgi:hypothetical protein